jgi:hypothetical protein
MSLITRPLESTTFASAASTIEAFNLPTGNYNGLFNGTHRLLNITSIDQAGKFNGTMDLSSDVKGYFDDMSGKITFIREKGSRPSDVEIYTGYVANFNFKEMGDCITDGKLICRGNDGCYDASDVANLAGMFVSFAEGNAKRNTFGWSAAHQLKHIPC